MLINSKILDKQFQQSISSIWAKDLNMRNLKIGVMDFITNEREKISKFKKNSANKKSHPIPVEGDNTIIYFSFCSMNLLPSKMTL